MAGLEPARISPHAPQTCAYTDSATSTQTILFNFQSLFCFVLVAEQSLSLLPSPQKQHLVAFSSAECHIDTNDFIQFSKFILFCPRGGAIAFAFALSSKATFSCFLVGRVPHRHKYIIMDKSPCQFKNLSFVFFKYQRSVVSAKAERIG